ncbi:MAG: gamma-glutamyl-gamma-aminobutyrate hydrolase family protein [Candidatus Woesearchaeota archaeon]|nr:MAG: gamma-glutamyl-gamma-aminobutyrate hydrolase family protein [Candidatus Woesearchaeota archaeon]
MIVAISQRNDRNKNGDLIDNLENNYINYLEKFGIKLITIPNSTKNFNYYFEKLYISGVILSGGNSVRPKNYGGEEYKSDDFSEERDEIEKNMLKTSIEKNLPVLGICRGMQFINVFFNGKLISNIKEEIESKIEHVAKTHKIKIIDEVVKKELCKEANVNSYHNQGVNSKTLSSELKPFAIAEDGIIEGIFHPKLPIAGIQWHPERNKLDHDEQLNEKIIKLFINKELFWREK